MIKREGEKKAPPSFRYLLLAFAPHLPMLIHSLDSKPAQFVTVIVSKAPTEQKFVVHKELICFHSPFFNAAFNGKFIKGQTQEMRMDDVDEEAFGQLVHWL
jgi:BTB/POZ domain